MLNAVAMIPTYNERDNIAGLIRDILELDPSFGVVVVDDDSPDGTSREVAAIGEKEPRVHLITRKNKKGRGTAGIEGMLYAVELGAKFIIEMDADYSHHPRYIPALVEAMQDCDIAIGSRAVAGGRETGRGAIRIGITQFANKFIRAVMGLPVMDCTSGFRCFKRQVLQAIGLENMVSVGPSIVEEILYACHLQGFKIREIPIVFEDRVKGQSTKTLGQFVDTLVRIIRFRVSMKR